MFSIHLENFLLFSSTLKLSSANSFSLEDSKICRLGKVNELFFVLFGGKAELYQTASPDKS